MAQKQSLDYSNLMETEGTETEMDTTEKAKKLCPKYLKALEAHDKRKKSVESDSRAMTGFMMLAVWNLSYMLGTIYEQIVI